MHFHLLVFDQGAPRWPHRGLMLPGATSNPILICCPCENSVTHAAFRTYRCSVSRMSRVDGSGMTVQSGINRPVGTDRANKGSQRPCGVRTWPWKRRPSQGGASVCNGWWRQVPSGVSRDPSLQPASDSDHDLDYSGDQGPMRFIAPLRVHTQPLPDLTESPPMSCFAYIHCRRSRIQYSGAINE
jgi:hypothetical protein